MSDFEFYKNDFIRTDEIKDLWGFLKSIDWTERWLQCLLVFHVALTCLTILTRHHFTVQGLLFFVLLLVVKCAELINEYGANNWKRFSRQQYFDSDGMFISVVLSMPVLFNCMMMVINWLWQSSNFIVRLKRVELEAKVKALSHSKDSQKKKSE